MLVPFRWQLVHTTQAMGSSWGPASQEGPGGQQSWPHSGLPSRRQTERPIAVSSVQDGFYIHGLFLLTPMLQHQPHSPSQHGATSSLGGPPLTGLCLQRWGGEKRGSLSTKWLPCGLSPPERGERRKEEGSTELGFKYSRSYIIEDKSNTLWGRGTGRNQGQIPPPSRGTAPPESRGEGRDWREKNLGAGGAQGWSHLDLDA